MDKWLVNICLFLIIGMMIHAGVTVRSQEYVSYNRKEDTLAESWGERMEETESEGVYYYKTLLPDEDIAGRVVAYRTAHMEFRARIGGEEVFALTIPDGATIRTTGYHWSFITLTDEDRGKEIEFEVTPVYADSYPSRDFYYGSRMNVERMVVRERVARFLVALTIILAGCILKAYDWLVVRKENKDTDRSLQHFSSFAIMLGTWSICESQILELYISAKIALVYLDHMMLMCMPILFLLFLRHMYHNRDFPLWKICCYVNLGVVLVRVLLQVAGVWDLRESLWLTHACLGLFIVVVIAMSIHEVVVYKISKELQINIICVLVIMAATICELIIYRIVHESTPYGSIGFLFYIVVMGTVSLRKNRVMMERARESEIYRRLAFMDELTGVYNRTAFNRDKESRMIQDQKTHQAKIPPTVLFMFDLNDLKKCNDTYGHEYGDQYITMVSGVLKQIFGLDGNCYRIGGDEFCVMMPFRNENDIKSKLLQFKNVLKEKNRMGFVVPVSVAVGYGIYDSSKDQTLDDTMRRADEIMYQEKQRMKVYREADGA
ncbi:MAG: GGDEF domain-containing protein [Butyrivibrio sp.]|nr:GGDEF domain-containing protein [Muribaculum sp.]MCM1553231.1 GGDEF domain-containing protein [Butyrivibrio sp.]